MRVGLRALLALVPASCTVTDDPGVLSETNAARNRTVGGAYALSAPASGARLVISEVMANVAGADRQFVEIYNDGQASFDLAGARLSDGDAVSVLRARAGSGSAVAPGAYAVVVHPAYTGVHGIPGGVTVLEPSAGELGTGLSATDRITLYASDGVTVLATAHHLFPSGGGVSVERLDLLAGDEPSNWRACPCGESAGAVNCAGAPPSGLVINEVMATPVDDATGEFVELYNPTVAPIDVASMTLSDGSASSTIVGRAGGSTVIGAQGFAVVLDPQWPAANLAQIDPSAVLLTVGGNALGNGLAANDPVTLRSASGILVDTYTRTLAAGRGRSVEKIAQAFGDSLGNWARSPCAQGSSPGSLNCASNPIAASPIPLRISEVMANPRDEDSGEFVELHNRGTSSIDAGGLLLGDGDATDRLVGFSGGTTVIPASGYAVVLDSEYAGQYALPPSAVLLTTEDTTIGSGLGLDDRVRLLDRNGITIIDTFRSPFGPENGVSVERRDLRVADSPANWVASSCSSGSSPGAANCSAAKIAARIRITEVLSNQAGTETGGAGEFVEFVNVGAHSVDLVELMLEIGPIGGTLSRDLLRSYLGGPTLLVPGAYAVVLDPDYDGRFVFPSGTVIVTLSDANFGAAGLATTHGVRLLDGADSLDAFVFPSDPGDGVSLQRRSLLAVDSAANWSASPCGASPGSGSCAMGGGVTSFLSFWADDDAGGRGHVWQQVVGNPHRASCNDLVVCASGAYPYRGNVAAPVAFAFTNPYPDRPVTFVERNGPDDTCTDPCTNNAVEVAPSAATTVPASSLGYYYVETGPPRLNGLSWYEGDPARYRSLPPDETLAPFIVEVP